MKRTRIACVSVLSMVGSIFISSSTSALPCYIIDSRGNTIDLGFICQAQTSAPRTENTPEANNTTPVEIPPVNPATPTENATPTTNQNTQNTSTTPVPRTNTPTLNNQ